MTLYSPAPVSRAEILSTNALFSNGLRLAFSCVLMFKFLLDATFIVRFLSVFVVFISLKFALNSSPFKRYSKALGLMITSSFTFISLLTAFIAVASFATASTLMAPLKPFGVLNSYEISPLSSA